MRETRRVRAAGGRRHAGGDLAGRRGAVRGRRTRLRVYTAPVTVQSLHHRSIRALKKKVA